MESLAFIAIVIGGLALLLLIGGIVADHWPKSRRPMARYVDSDILPPPSPQCERRGNVLEFRRASR